LGIGDWGLGPIPNPHPQSPILNIIYYTIKIIEIPAIYFLQNFPYN